MYKYAVIYNGAPYGDDETGHVVSRHRTMFAAMSAARSKFRGSREHVVARRIGNVWDTHCATWLNGVRVAASAQQGEDE